MKPVVLRSKRLTLARLDSQNCHVHGCREGIAHGRDPGERDCFFGASGANQPVATSAPCGHIACDAGTALLATSTAVLPAVGAGRSRSCPSSSARHAHHAILALCAELASANAGRVSARDALRAHAATAALATTTATGWPNAFQFSGLSVFWVPPRHDERHAVRPFSRSHGRESRRCYA